MPCGQRCGLRQRAEQVGGYQPFRIDAAIILQAERCCHRLGVERCCQSDKRHAVLKTEKNRFVKIRRKVLRLAKCKQGPRGFFIGIVEKQPVAAKQHDSRFG